MCLVVFAWNAFEGHRLVLVGHRDEFHDRDAAAMHWWPDRQILAGRDLMQGGTWLGVTAEGRFGVITNLRGAHSPPSPPSRGGLIPEFLTSSQRPGEFLEGLAGRRHRYAGFSLILGDRSEAAYLSSGGSDEPRALDPGIYALSNGPLGATWPKVTMAQARLEARLQTPVTDPDQFFDVLADTTPANDADLPDTGVGHALERALSPAFIVGAHYGTRAATVLTLPQVGGGTVIERVHHPDGSVTGIQRFELGPTAQ